MNELRRFVSLYDHQVRHTFRFVESLPSEAWTSVPVDGEFMHLGNRVERITIASLITHLFLAESHWFKQVAVLQRGEAISIPPSTMTLVRSGPAVVNAFRDQHEATLRLVRTLPEAQLRTEVTFVGRHFSVMGFLWVVLAHHGFHLGQIDLLMRQGGQRPMEFLEWEATRVIG